MFVIDNLRKQEFLSLEIQKNCEFILSNIDFSNPKINIHIQGQGVQKLDYPRMFFILCTLARASSTGHFKIDRSKFIKLFWDLYKLAEAEKIKSKIDFSNFRFVELYGMRALNFLKEDFSQLLESFKKGSYENIYSYPVTSYVFVTTFLECELRKKYEYSSEIFNQSMKIFDYITYSSAKNNFLPFHFAELSLWENKFDKNTDLLARDAGEIISSTFTTYLNSQPSASGVAKCLEHFSRIGDLENYFKAFVFLNSRNIQKYKNYLNPDFLKFENIFTENENSQYICLDTNAHIVHSLINLYEKTI